MTRNSTPASLLERLASPGDEGAWAKFVQLYTPFIFYLGQRQGLSNDDSSDLVQDVFVLLAQRMQAFRYDPEKSFRAWLRTVTVNRIREIARRRRIDTVQFPEYTDHIDGNDHANHVELYSDEEYQQFVANRALKLMRTEFSATTWQACWEHVVSGRSAAEIGSELGLSEGAVYAAKSRVLKRLREELDGLWD